MIKSIVQKFFALLGFQLVRDSKHNVYCDGALETVKAAEAKNQSVCEYVEELWDQRGCTQRVIDEMEQCGVFNGCNNVCEIGPGTGRYVDLVIKHAAPRRYEIYEVAQDWAKWIKDTYPPVVLQPADGHTLATTEDGSCQLVHGHGVFVYLSLLHCFEYFFEMIRVCSLGGFIVFDYYSNLHFDLPTIDKWLESPDRFPVVLERSKVVEFFCAHGFKLLREFDNKHSRSFSQYLIFKRGE